MLGEILRFLIEIIFTLFGAILLARAWLFAVRLHPFNPISQAIHQATNWLVTPLRKLLPDAKSFDWASLLAAALTAVIYLLLMWIVSTATMLPPGLFPALLGAALVRLPLGTEPGGVVDADPGHLVLGQPASHHHARLADADRTAA